MGQKKVNSKSGLDKEKEKKKTKIRNKQPSTKHKKKKKNLFFFLFVVDFIVWFFFNESVFFSFLGKGGKSMFKFFFFSKFFCVSVFNLIM